MKKIIIFSLFLFVLIQSVTAITNFIPSSSKDIIAGTLAIEQSTGLTFPKNSNPNIHIHVFNSTGILINNASCKIHLYDNLNRHFLIADMDSEFDGYNFTLSTNYTRRIGLYNYEIWCNISKSGGFASQQFEITPSGEQNNINIPLLIIIIIIFAIALFIFGAIYSESVLVTISGMIFSIVGIYIVINGFSNLNNYLTISLAIVLFGIGAFFMIRPYLNDIVEYFNKL